MACNCALSPEHRARTAPEHCQIQPQSMQNQNLILIPSRRSLLLKRESSHRPGVLAKASGRCPLQHHHSQWEGRAAEHCLVQQSHTAVAHQKPHNSSPRFTGVELQSNRSVLVSGRRTGMAAWRMFPGRRASDRQQGLESSYWMGRTLSIEHLGNVL